MHKVLIVTLTVGMEEKPAGWEGVHGLLIGVLFVISQNYFCVKSETVYYQMRSSFISCPIFVNASS